MNVEKLSVEERVYVERVRLFFGSAIGNVLSAVVGGIFVSLVLMSANVVLWKILTWLGFVIFFALITIYIEKRFTNDTLCIHNASRRLLIRTSASILIAITYGLAPFLFSSYLGIQEEMFLFIILSAMVSVAIVGYTTMPRYYMLLSATTMTPLTIYYLSHFDSMHLILAMIAAIWQYMVLSKAWKVSKLAIESLTLHEQLQDELEHHKKTKEQLHQLATHDILTELPNRRLLMQNLETMLSLAKRQGQKVFVLFLDLDGFKEVNDMYGHEAGDYVLVEISNRLNLHTRDSDTLARLGGDEFVLGFLEQNTKKISMDILAQRIIDSIIEPIVLPSGDMVRVCVSIGIAQFPGCGETPEELMKAADGSMYVAKSNGGSAFEYALFLESTK